ncbi:transposase, partial [Thermoanaerobacter ethanolicus JW 200]
IDSTHVKQVPIRKIYKRNNRTRSQDLPRKLEEEINKDREAHGKKPLKKIKTIKTKEVKVSKTDPDSGMLNKNEKKNVLHIPFTQPAIKTDLY